MRITTLSVGMFLIGAPTSGFCQEDDGTRPQVELDPIPSTGQSHTIPGTNGYGVGGGLPQFPGNQPPATGGYLGLRYPPDQGPTKTYCNGKPC